MSCLFEKSRRKVVVIFLLYLVSNIFEVVALAVPVFKAVGTTRSVAYGVTHFVGNAFHYFSPIAMGIAPEIVTEFHESARISISVTIAFSLQVLFCLDLAYTRYVEHIALKSSCGALGSLANTGFALYSLTKKANEMLGGLIAVEYTANLINISAAAFFAARYSGDIEIKVGQFNAYRVVMMIGGSTRTD